MGLSLSLREHKIRTIKSQTHREMETESHGSQKISAGFCFWFFFETFFAVPIWKIAEQPKVISSKSYKVKFAYLFGLRS